MVKLIIRFFDYSIFNAQSAMSSLKAKKRIWSDIRRYMDRKSIVYSVVCVGKRTGICTILKNIAHGNTRPKILLMLYGLHKMRDVSVKKLHKMHDVFASLIHF